MYVYIYTLFIWNPQLRYISKIVSIPSMCGNFNGVSDKPCESCFGHRDDSIGTTKPRKPESSYLETNLANKKGRPIAPCMASVDGRFSSV